MSKHTAEEVDALAFKLGQMADKNRVYELGEYWDACDDAAIMLSDLLAEREQLRGLLTKVRDSFIYSEDDVPGGIGVMQEAENHHFDEICAVLNPPEAA